MITEFNTRILKPTFPALFQDTNYDKNESTRLDSSSDNDVIVPGDRNVASLSVRKPRNIKQNGSAFNLFLSTGKHL
jgi:hypothetical protein